MGVVGSILTMLLMLSILTIVHEWGHFIAARIFKVNVQEFSIFMGPKIFSKVSKKTGTKFSLRWIPIGGYCAMEGEETSEDSPTSYNSKPWYMRLVILFAGAFMNILLALLIVTVMLAYTGYESTRVSLVSDDLPYALTSLEEGDQVVSFNGRGLTTPTDYYLFQYADGNRDTNEFVVKKKNGDKVTYRFVRTVTVTEAEEEGGASSFTAHTEVFENGVPAGTYESERTADQSLKILLRFAEDGNSSGRMLVSRKIEYAKTGEHYQKTITETFADGSSETRQDTETAQKVIDSAFGAHSPYQFGFNYSYHVKGNIFEYIGHGFLSLISMVKSVLYSLGWLITGKVGLDAVAGPIGLTTLVGEVVTANAAFVNKLLTLCNMAALISVNLGVFNLLPFPGLDGGKFLLTLIEGITKKRIPPEKEAVISLIGLALLIGLAIFVAGSDILKIIRGTS